MVTAAVPAETVTVIDLVAAFTVTFGIGAGSVVAGYTSILNLRTVEAVVDVPSCVAVIVAVPMPRITMKVPAKVTTFAFED